MSEEDEEWEYIVAFCFGGVRECSDGRLLAVDLFEWTVIIYCGPR